jgi:deazaflavin-dependent oxidoreductase (nitroreductase family)
MSPILGRRVARFNRRVTNHLTRPFARRLPGFGVVVHTGRSSKRRYQTPVNVFRAGDCFVIALTYGADADWVKNVRAAGGCEIINRGRHRQLSNPQVSRDEKRQLVPRPLRLPLLLLHVSDFLQLEVAEQGEPTPATEK